MTRSLQATVLAAAGLWLAATAHAQSNVRVYGLVDASVGRFQNSGAPKDNAVDSGGMSTSFLGIKGSEDIIGSLKAKFAIEHFVQIDRGTAGRFDGDSFWSRNAYVGLQGEFGSTTLGRHATPLFISTVMFNAFGDSSAFSPSVRQIFTPALAPFFGDSRWNNSVAFTTDGNGNGSEGLNYSLTYNLGESAPGSTGKNVSVGTRYFSGPLGASFTWQRAQNGAGISSAPLAVLPAGFTRQNSFQFGVSYDMTVAKLFGQYTQIKTRASTNTRSQLYSFGTAVPLGRGKLLAQYGRASASGAGEPTHQTLSLGYDHELSKLTDVYAVVMSDKVSGLARGNTLAAGMRLRF